MRRRELAIVWLALGLTSACDVPVETFHRADAGLPGGPADAGPGALAQQAYIKPSNTGAGDLFGASVALSADGSTLAVGAWRESSAATGIDGNQADNTAMDAGAVYVFVRSGTTWRQQAYVKASSTDAGDLFGSSVALSADGSVLAVGAPMEASAATGIEGNPADNTAMNAGAVYVFVRSGTAWSRQAYIKASNTGAGDLFGTSVALSGSGTTLAVGAIGEASAATGIGGNQADNSIPGAGAVYVFAFAGTAWGQQAYVKASNAGQRDAFGNSVTLSADGSTLAVAARYESSAASGIGGDQTDNSSTNAGAVYVFTRTQAAWMQQAYIKASNTVASNTFGNTVRLSGDGSTLAVGSTGESSKATGIGGNQFDFYATASGAVYVFTRTGASWSQQVYIKASNAATNDYFGRSVALSGDGSILAVGADEEDSAATGIGGDQADNSAVNSGAVYLFARSGTTWSQRAYVKASNTGAGDGFCDAALSADGATLAVGAFGEASAVSSIDGIQTDNSAAMAGAVYLFH